jgi:uncharacterized membrane protein YcaP (DUF421 family)
VTGGIIGAFGLLAINWLVVRALFRSPRLTRMMEGRATVLVRNGQVDKNALKREALTREELMEVIHRQGFEGIHQVHQCEIEPNGTFYAEPFEPSIADKRHEELVKKLEVLEAQIAALKA